MNEPRRILVVTSGALFVRGGHLTIAEETASALRRAGHLAEVVVTPQNRFGRQLSAYLATWLTDVGETADGKPVDQVISFRFPSCAVRHPRHVCWLNHRMREYYDLWERFVRGLGRKGRLKEGVRRRMFHTVDRWLLTHNVTRLVAQSRTIQARLQRFGGIRSELLYPPPPERAYRTGGYGDYVLAVSRLHPLKRPGRRGPRHRARRARARPRPGRAPGRGRSPRRGGVPLGASGGRTPEARLESA